MIKRLLWGLCLLLTTMSANAQTLRKVDAAQQKSMVEKINRTAASIRSIDCSFTQVKTLQFLNDKMTSQGRMLFVAEGAKLRWEYQTPYSYTFILNGQKVFIHSQKNTQTIDISQSRLFQSIAEVMLNSVTGKSLSTNADFVCAMMTQGDDWVADLVPKKKELKKMFKSIRLYFGSKQQMVTRVEMTEQNGDTTMITLKDVKTNGRVDEKMFAAR